MPVPIYLGACIGSRTPAALAESIVQDARTGLAAVHVDGRPTAVNDDLLHVARDMLSNPAHSITKLLSLSPGTPYHHIPEPGDLRTAGRTSAARPRAGRPH
ncbi:hypothetical protein [Actinomadura sp. CNU-125]|uniref:hypothetical protein n=1 Tax=Actinomadura sp. CNU-125 TaxID=1904961 RepID=UPI0011786B39|nr:hypothetical protein [Actinomadura sp. CNU-125]